MLVRATAFEYEDLDCAKKTFGPRTTKTNANGMKAIRLDVKTMRPIVAKSNEKIFLPIESTEKEVRGINLK